MRVKCSRHGGGGSGLCYPAAACRRRCTAGHCAGMLLLVASSEWCWFFARNCGLVTLGKMFMWEAEANRQALSTKRHNFLLGNLHLFFFSFSELNLAQWSIINYCIPKNQPFHGSKPNQKECFHDCFSNFLLHQYCQFSNTIQLKFWNLMI